MNLDEEYWTKRYADQTTGWDIGYVSTPLAEYFDQLQDKSIRILIPGAGNGYEALYLYELGFQNITVCDLSALPLEKFKNHSVIQCIQGDFFDLTESTKYDLIIEQTFFCALDPSLRKAYVQKMDDLLCENGKLVGLLFATPFEAPGPPFGGYESDYRILFGEKWNILTMDLAFNSILQRKGNEIFFIAQKKGKKLG